MKNQNNTGTDMTVIVPVYNVEAYLPACIESLQKQKDIRLEIIIIDDGSTDLSGFIAAQYAVQDSRIQIIRQKNKGLSAARNAGLERARGEFIVFLDSDDWVKENSLSKLFIEAIGNQADVVMGNFMYSYQEKVVEGYFKPVPNELRYIPFSGKEGFIRLIKSNAYAPMAWNYIYRRLFLEQIQARFDESIMHEDELWTPIVLAQAEKLIAVDVDFYYYRQREASLTNASGLPRRLDSLFRVADRLLEFAGKYDFSGNDG